MTSGADLFVVCKQCGSEVSPYITECPYCGNRLRRRAPKLPRAQTATRTRRRSRLGGLLRGRRRSPATRPGGYGGGYGSGRWEGTRPYATIAIVAVSAGLWIAKSAHPQLYGKLVLHPEFVLKPQLTIVGPLHEHWWRVITTQFAYANGVYAFATLMVIAIFGWLMEHRHGPAVVLALFLGVGAAGALVACAVYAFPVIGGGNAGALALLAAWAAPDLRAARRGEHYEGDLLGAAAAAALMLAMPFAVYEANWLAGVTAGALGLLLGFGLGGLSRAE
jgi:membrane associated rhomboid family serine protease